MGKRFVLGDIVNPEIWTEFMDKQIRKLEKQESKVGKGLKHLEKEDKKRDKECDLGKKMMKKKK